MNEKARPEKPKGDYTTLYNILGNHYDFQTVYDTALKCWIVEAVRIEGYDH